MMNILFHRAKISSLCLWLRPVPSKTTGKMNYQQPSQVHFAWKCIQVLSLFIFSGILLVLSALFIVSLMGGIRCSFGQWFMFIRLMHIGHAHGHTENLMFLEKFGIWIQLLAHSNKILPKKQPIFIAQKIALLHLAAIVIYIF